MILWEWTEVNLRLRPQITWRWEAASQLFAPGGRQPPSTVWWGVDASGGQFSEVPQTERGLSFLSLDSVWCDGDSA